jgi:hypothetical protein
MRSMAAVVCGGGAGGDMRMGAALILSVGQRQGSVGLLLSGY